MFVMFEAPACDVKMFNVRTQMLTFSCYELSVMRPPVS